MPLFKIEATREVYYDFEIEAETEDQAIAEIERIERDEDVEIYAIDWYPLEVQSIEEEEEVE
jgi:hypothetical protein